MTMATSEQTTAALEQSTPEVKQGGDVPAPEADKPYSNPRFWAIFTGITASSILSGLDASVFATALPTIVRNLRSRGNYIWAIDIYFLTTAAVQPACGHVADVYGRRWPMIISTVVFMVGSGICGGARNIATLIAGRAVQGLGNGGLCTLTEIIISDLVPLKDRSMYFGLVFAILSCATSFGPFVGGALAQDSTWRWIFWLNFPIGGPALVLLVFFLTETLPQKPDSRTASIVGFDYVGTALIIGGTFAITFAVATGGNGYSWASGRVLTAMVIGLACLPAFCMYEASSICHNPVMPPRFFRRLSTGLVFLVTFLSGLLVFWICYFYPFYFQAVQVSSPSRAGVQMLPWSLTFPVACVAGGGMLMKFGRYKLMHVVCLTLLTVCFGCSSLLSNTSSVASWILLEIGLALSSGGILATLLPALQATLSDRDTAKGVAVWAYLRTFGLFWGTTIPGVVLTARFNRGLSSVGDPELRARLADGQAYQSASKIFIESIASVASRTEVVALYTTSLRFTWYIGLVFAILAFLACCIEKEYPLKKEKEKEKQEPADTSNGESGGSSKAQVRSVTVAEDKGFS